ncbi:MAG: hypothetical protein AAGA20_23870 [Planctomycetota bacterium]
MTYDTLRRLALAAMALALPCAAPLAAQTALGGDLARDACVGGPCPAKVIPGWDVGTSITVRVDAEWSGRARTSRDCTPCSACSASLTIEVMNPYCVAVYEHYAAETHTGKLSFGQPYTMLLITDCGTYGGSGGLVRIRVRCRRSTFTTLARLRCRCP